MDLQFTDDPFTVTVMVVGPSGSGKTVYLASLFHKLHVQRRSLSIYLTTKLPVRTRLSKLFSEVANTESDFPKSTRIADSRNYIFDCRTAFKNAAHSIMRVEYMDFAGDLLTDATKDEATEGNTVSSSQMELQDAILSADTILCLLDGAMVYKLASEDIEGYRYFNEEMSPTFGLLQEASKPVHFVITKWDLLQGLAETPSSALEMVKQQLLTIPDIAGLVDVSHAVRGENKPVMRLIPVSAVGIGFCTALPDGQMVKKSDAIPDPLFVEIPLVAALRDLFDSIIASLDEETKRQINETMAQHSLTLRDRLRLVAGFTLDKSSGFVTSVANTFFGTKSFQKLNEASIQILVETLRRPAYSKMEEKKLIEDDKDRVTEEAASARRIALHAMYDELERFERMFPASILRSQGE